MVGLAGLVLAGASLPRAADAQRVVAPSQVTPETLRPAAPQTTPQISLTAPAGQAAPPDADKLFVTLAGAQADGTFPGFEEKTAEILAPLKAGRISVARIYEISNALEQAYNDAGYFLARVVIPPQQLADGGTVHLTVIDGVIERVELKEVPEQQRGVVLDRVNSLIGKHHLMLDEMERRLLLVSDIPGFQVRSTLSPGDKPGSTLLELQGKQTYANGTFGVDNRLPTSLGGVGLNASATLNSALGLGEQTYLSIMTSPEMFPARLRVLGGGFSVPVGGDGLTVNPEYTKSQARPIAPTGTPATQGDFQRFAVRANYPIIRGRETNLNLQGSIEWENEQLVPLGFSTKLYSDEYEAGRLRATYNFSPWKNVPVSITGALSHGLAGRTATVTLPLSRVGASPNFTSFLAEANIQNPMPFGSLLTVTARGQTSFGSPLMLSEQFSLDGGNALSGFSEGTFSVDQGATLRAELSRPFLLPVFGHPFLLSPYVFGAGGFGDIVMPTVVERRDVGAGSAGVGMRTDSGVPGLFGGTLALEFARKFSDVPAVHSGYRGNVSLSLRF